VHTKEIIELMPIGPLMSEHRLIEKMIDLLTKKVDRIREEASIDPKFVDIVIDFFKIYADRCHHGKEENILFRDLAKKQLSDEHKKIMTELIAEHAYARKTVSSLEEAKEKYVQGKMESLADIQTILKQLTVLYPAHIEKEDKHFFYPSMEYFTRQELDEMLQEFWEFDRKLLHEKYEEIVESIKIPPLFKTLITWRCTVCNYVYDPTKGDPEHGIKAGTPFEELPEEWCCPICFAAKKAFVRVE